MRIFLLTNRIIDFCVWSDLAIDDKKIATLYLYRHKIFEKGGFFMFFGRCGLAPYNTNYLETGETIKYKYDDWFSEKVYDLCSCDFCVKDLAQWIKDKYVKN